MVDLIRQQLLAHVGLVPSRHWSMVDGDRMSTGLAPVVEDSGATGRSRLGGHRHAALVLRAHRRADDVEKKNKLRAVKVVALKVLAAMAGVAAVPLGISARLHQNRIFCPVVLPAYARCTTVKIDTMRGAL